MFRNQLYCSVDSGSDGNLCSVASGLITTKNALLLRENLIRAMNEQFIHNNESKNKVRYL